MGRESKGAVGQMVSPVTGKESKRLRKMGSWYVSGEAAGAGWRIEGTTDATGRGKKEKMARWKAKVRRKLAMEDGRREVS
jgi:hypothetical protein